MAITYRKDAEVSIDDFIDLYVTSTLGERRPIQDYDCMRRMKDEADLTITAWDDNMLVGISRVLTDWCYVAYLSDLAVRESYQRQGVGKELIRKTQAALEPTCSIVLLAAPDAVAYYPRIGMSEHDSAWVLRPGQKIK
jgi:ribosomal protein S18 acetylase RimI-like enzyme